MNSFSELKRSSLRIIATSGIFNVAREYSSSALEMSRLSEFTCETNKELNCILINICLENDLEFRMNGVTSQVKESPDFSDVHGRAWRGFENVTRTVRSAYALVPH